LHVLDVLDMNILSNNYTHNSEGFMMAVTEFGTEKSILTAGDDRKIKIRDWDGNILDTLDSSTIT
jgi:hypothetical protein